MPAHSTISQEVEMNAMMQQAVSRSATSGSRINRSNCAASLHLPDYVGVALAVFEAFKEKAGDGGQVESCECVDIGHKL